MRTLRRLHTYLSIAAAPTILFFCLTGSVQLFGWHESRGGYQAPAWIEKLGTLHKKQRFAVRGGGRPGAPPAVAADAPPGSPPPGERGRAEPRRPPPAGLRVLLLRWVFLFATLSLVASTAMGLWLGLTHVKRRRLGWALLVAGTVLPLVLVGG